MSKAKGKKEKSNGESPPTASFDSTVVGPSSQVGQVDIERNLYSKNKPLNIKEFCLVLASLFFGTFLTFAIAQVSLNIYCGIVGFIGFLFGFCSLWCLKKKKGLRSLKLVSFGGTVIAAAWVILFCKNVAFPTILGQIELANKTATYTGVSDILTQTMIVPTLDTPIAKDKNIIWCSSFQIAWNDLQENIFGEPVQLINAEGGTNRLNRAKQSRQDIQEESYYVASGFVKDGVEDKIQTEMGRRFPSTSIPQFEDMSQDQIIAYAYLEANVKFKIPFHKNNKEFLFKDSSGLETPVESFGIWKARTAYRDIREQVEILYFSRDTETGEATAFAVDLSKDTQPYQIVLACLEPGDDLSGTFADLQNKITHYTGGNTLLTCDRLKVPEMFWNITHHFNELENKSFGNVGYEDYHIRTALQTIQFKLDRSGATLKSTVFVEVLASPPKLLIFDRPFLIYLKKRDATYPFFVMWVNNAELLSKS